MGHVSFREGTLKLLQHSLSTKRSYNSEASNLQHQKNKKTASDIPPHHGSTPAPHWQRQWQHSCRAYPTWNDQCHAAKTKGMNLKFSAGYFQKIGVFPPKSSIFNRVFQYFHHPFLGVKSPYFWVDTQLHCLKASTCLPKYAACIIWLISLGNLL